MRLAILEHGHRLPARAFKRVAALAFRAEVDDVIKTAMHRPEFFGRAFLALCAEVQRGPSFWTPAEREYLAVVTSRLNECPYCARVHDETMRIEPGGAGFDVDAGRTGRPELAAVVPLVEKAARAADDLTVDDVDRVRAAGVPDDAIVDALHVVLVFNTVNRLANAFGWSWDSGDHVRIGARALHRFGYKLPGFALR